MKATSAAMPAAALPAPGFGVPCADVQCDGVPCPDCHQDCCDCERAKPAGAPPHFTPADKTHA